MLDLPALQEKESPMYWQHVREFMQLLWVRLKTQYFNTLNYLQEVYHFYGNRLFRRVDRALGIAYLFDSPFALSKRFLQERGDAEIYCYGETPLTSLVQIAKMAGIGPQDTVFELGCGRGRTCFWLNIWLKCCVVGVDCVPDFIAKADLIKKRYALEGVSFRLEDMLETDLTGASVIYLYGSCYEDPFIEALVKRLETLPKGTRVISVSYPLQDYTKKDSFVLTSCCPIQYPWGVADVFVQVRQ